MGAVLMVLGYGWAMLGVVTCYSGINDPAAQSDTAVGMTTILSMLVFVLPGGVVGAIGQHLARRTGPR